MTQKLAKCFRFDEDIRSKLTFSDATKIRLNPATNRLELRSPGKKYSSGLALYPLDTDLFVTVAATNPQTLVKWLGFSVTPRPTLQPANTSVGIKLNDGTNDRYWDGGAWAVAGAADWNTEQVIVANIATFPATSQTLSVIINLVTTDKYATPTVEAIDLLMECDISYLRSLISESFIATMKEDMRPTINITLDAPGGTVISLLDLETRYNIATVLAVYNHTDDPEHQTNLFSSYEPVGKSITISSAIARGAAVWVDFTVEPEVYLNWGDQDYIEITKLPAIIIDKVKLEGSDVWAEQTVKNISTFIATVRVMPFRLAIEFDIVLAAEGNRTLLEMWDKAFKFDSDHPTLTWRALDEEITLRMASPGGLNPRPNLRNKYKAGYTMRLENVYIWTTAEESVPLVQSFNLTLTHRQ